MSPPHDEDQPEDKPYTAEHQAQVFTTQQLLDIQRRERHLARKDRFQSLFKKAV